MSSNNQDANERIAQTVATMSGRQTANEVVLAYLMAELVRLNDDPEYAEKLTSDIQRISKEYSERLLPTSNQSSNTILRFSIRSLIPLFRAGWNAGFGKLREHFQMIRSEEFLKR